MNRRSFLRKGMAAAACYGLSNSVFAKIAANTAEVGVFKKKNRIGIQLYSVREDLIVDFKGTVQKLAAIGYANIESYGFDGESFMGYSLKEQSIIAKDMGLKLTCTHCGTGLLPADTQAKEWDYWRKTANGMKEAEGKMLVQPWLPEAKTLDDLKRLTEQFNKVGEICKNSGLKFGFHNHDTEFKQIEGQVIQDFLLQNTDPALVFFQFDLGHALNGGVDILAYLKKYPKRFLSWHATDFKKGQGYTELGKGDVPYDKLFKIAKSYGLEDLVMEHEEGPDRYGSCKRNFEFLSKYSWTKA